MGANSVVCVVSLLSKLDEEGKRPTDMFLSYPPSNGPQGGIWVLPLTNCMSTQELFLQAQGMGGMGIVSM